MAQQRSDPKQRSSPEALYKRPGLEISRGFVEAMRGTISTANRTDRSGAVLTIRLPIPAAVDALDTAA
jgi:K+-sensing histidine kinase KdpD